MMLQTHAESIMGVDCMCSNTVGLVGEPYDITSTSNFNSTTITFTVDQDSLGTLIFNNLKILWYDEENQRFIEMKTIADETNSTLSTNVNPFSKYLIVDSEIWYVAWKTNYYQTNINNLHTAITIDCSASIRKNDLNR